MGFKSQSIAKRTIVFSVCKFKQLLRLNGTWNAPNQPKRHFRLQLTPLSTSLPELGHHLVYLAILRKGHPKNLSSSKLLWSLTLFFFRHRARTLWGETAGENFTIFKQDFGLHLHLFSTQRPPTTSQRLNLVLQTNSFSFGLCQNSMMGAIFKSFALLLRCMCNVLPNQSA